MKVGCSVNFTVQQLYCAPELARIHRRGRLSDHVNHGAALPAGSDPRLMRQGRFSKDLLDFVDRRLMQGVLPLAILREHQEFICGKLGSDGVFRSGDAERLERDSLLDIQAVRNRHVCSSFFL